MPRPRKKKLPHIIDKPIDIATVDLLVKKAVAKIIMLLKDEKLDRIKIRTARSGVDHRIIIFYISIPYPLSISIDTFYKMIDIIQEYGLEPKSFTISRRNLILRTRINVVDLDLLRQLLAEGLI